MILLYVAAVLAQEATDGAESVRFAAELLAMEQREAAWLEYERAALRFGPGPAADRARFSGCLALADADEAVICWRHAAAQSEPATAALFEFGLAEARYLRGEYAASAAKLGGLESPQLADARAYREAWILVREGEPAAARQRLDNIAPGAALYAPSREFSAELARDPELPTRSPALAGALSAALPGAGQLYAGEARDGASAFVANGVLIGGTAALAARKNWAGAALVGGLAVGFYAGNIFSAINSAQRRNLRLERAWLDELALRHELHLGISEGDPGAPLALELDLGAD